MYTQIHGVYMCVRNTILLHIYVLDFIVCNAFVQREKQPNQ